MSGEVGEAYDQVAELYTSHSAGALDRVPIDRDWLVTFADLVARHTGPVADLGCGPGYVVDFLADLGLDAVGYDVSEGLLAQARLAYPHSQFHHGDITQLDLDADSLAGIVSRYSLIHMDPANLGPVFAGWLRILQPDAPVLVSFFAASSADAHGEPFDHKVATAYQMFPATVAEQLTASGFGPVQIGVRGPREVERPLDHATLLAHKVTSPSSETN